MALGLTMLQASGEEGAGGPASSGSITISEAPAVHYVKVDDFFDGEEFFPGRLLRTLTADSLLFGHPAKMAHVLPVLGDLRGLVDDSCFPKAVQIGGMLNGDDAISLGERIARGLNALLGVSRLEFDWLGASPAGARALFGSLTEGALASVTHLRFNLLAIYRSPENAEEVTRAYADVAGVIAGCPRLERLDLTKLNELDGGVLSALVASDIPALPRGLKVLNLHETSGQSSETMQRLWPKLAVVDGLEELDLDTTLLGDAHMAGFEALLKPQLRIAALAFADGFSTRLARSWVELVRDAGYPTRFGFGANTLFRLKVLPWKPMAELDAEGRQKHRQAILKLSKPNEHGYSVGLTELFRGCSADAALAGRVIHELFTDAEMSDEDVALMERIAREAGYSEDVLRIWQEGDFFVPGVGRVAAD